MKFKLFRDRKNYSIMGPYPDLRYGAPLNYALPTTTSKILRPAVVFACIVLIAIVTVVGFVIAGISFSDRALPTRTVGAAQVFGFVAVSLILLSLVQNLILHLVFAFSALSWTTFCCGKEK